MVFYEDLIKCILKLKFATQLKKKKQNEKNVFDRKSQSTNPFHSAQCCFYVETSQMICTTNEMTGFNLKCSAGMKSFRDAWGLIVKTINYKLFANIVNYY